MSRKYPGFYDEYDQAPQTVTNTVQDMLAECDLNTEVETAVLWNNSVVEVISSGKEDSEYHIESTDWGNCNDIVQTVLREGK